MTAVTGSVAPAVRNRVTSSRIVDACIQYAERARYQEVTLSALCAASGASERRVRDAFYDGCGISPTTYLRTAALHEVRRSLIERPQTRDAVTRAASDFGFWHLSKFAGHYRALFGEPPSKTVMRARTERAAQAHPAAT
jgi:AraC family transcriptional regulator, ethanolamine operon transcriptional activator